MPPLAAGTCPCNYIAQIRRAEQHSSEWSQDSQQNFVRYPKKAVDLPIGQPPDGRNPLGNHDVILWTASRHALTRPASSARSPARNAARPAATTTNGSAATRS